MLEAGNYTVTDPLIKEIDKKIAALSWLSFLFYIY
jgi:hypothetical protein